MNLQFDESAIDALAEHAWQANENGENIGARRLHTVLEMLLSDIAFNAGGGDAPEVDLVVDANYVSGQLDGEIKQQDMKKFIL